MSRDQKPGKVRHVGTVQERRAATAQVTAPAATIAAGATAPAGDGGATAAAPAKGGIGLGAVLLFLVFAGVGGGGLVAFAPQLGLWP